MKFIWKSYSLYTKDTHQIFCENQNSVQDADQDYDFSLGFNTRPSFHTWKTPAKFCLDPLTPSKVIVSTAKVHVQPDRQTDRQTYTQTDIHTDRHTHAQTDRQTYRQTGRRKFFLLVLFSKTYKTWTFIKTRDFFFTHAITKLRHLFERTQIVQTRFSEIGWGSVMGSLNSAGLPHIYPYRVW